MQSSGWGRSAGRRPECCRSGCPANQDSQTLLRLSTCRSAQTTVTVADLTGTCTYDVPMRPLLSDPKPANTAISAFYHHSPLQPRGLRPHGHSAGARTPSDIGSLLGTSPPITGTPGETSRMEPYVWCDGATARSLEAAIPTPLVTSITTGAAVSPALIPCINRLTKTATHDERQ